MCLIRRKESVWLCKSACTDEHHDFKRSCVGRNMFVETCTSTEFTPPFQFTKKFVLGGNCTSLTSTEEESLYQELPIIWANFFLFQVIGGEDTESNFARSQNEPACPSSIFFFIVSTAQRLSFFGLARRGLPEDITKSWNWFNNCTDFVGRPCLENSLSSKTRLCTDECNNPRGDNRQNTSHRLRDPCLNW